MDLCFQLKVIPKENTFPEAEGERSKNQMCFSCTLGKHHSRPKPMGFSFRLDPSVQILVLQNLKMFALYSVVGKKSMFANLKHLVGFLVMISGAQGCWSAVLLASSVARCSLTSRLSRSINTQASGRPSWCLVCS